MERIEQSKLWKRTLGASGGSSSDERFRERLRSSFISFRKRVETLANQISSDIKSLTVHDITHIDALWETADTVIGDDYPISPTEAFVLGGAFLVHDLGLALASYPNGLPELKSDPLWRDTAIKTLRTKFGYAPCDDEISELAPEHEKHVLEEVLRLRHAKRAEDLVSVSYQHKDRDPEYHLLEDVELRESYGRLIGRIAYSHWWPIEDVSGDADMNRQIGPFPEGPNTWTIQPLKLAIVLRVSDACHLSAERAPGFQRALSKPDGISDHHWRIQEYLQKPTAVKKRVQITAAKPVPVDDIAAWWVGYDLVQVADQELRDAEVVLSDADLPALEVHGVAGCSSPKQLAKHIPTEGWIPVDASIRVTDVGSLVKKIGGEALYGSDPSIPLRELIQNARDAVVGRRKKMGYASDWGSISVRLSQDGQVEKLEVEDTGLGMSEALLSGAFIDFGTSYWGSHLSSKENPGLLATGFEPQGTYGIGFFSVFMLGDRVTVVTRRPEDGIDQTRVLEFGNGPVSRPIVRVANADERRDEPGTSVTVWLRQKSDQPHSGLLWPQDCTMDLLDSSRSRRKKAWPLAELCEWLCPALDVKLTAVDNAGSQSVIDPDDWKKFSGVELLRRLMLHREDIDTLIASGVLKKTAEKTRDLRSPNGDVIGRAAIECRYNNPKYNFANGDQFLPPEVVTSGCFRADASFAFPGIFLGRPTTAARSTAKPRIFDYPNEFAKWATEQAELVDVASNTLRENNSIAKFVRFLGGDTRHLPIAARLGNVLSYHDIVSLKDLPDELEMFEHHVGFEGVSFGEHESEIAVLGGMIIPCCDVPKDRHDFLQRSTHRVWTCQWLSVWGAVMEAIASNWNCSLQAMLDFSFPQSGNAQANSPTQKRRRLLKKPI